MSGVIEEREVEEVGGFGFDDDSEEVGAGGDAEAPREGTAGAMA